MARLLPLCISCFLIAPAVAAPVLLPKQVNAPPADILSGIVRLPEPGTIALESSYARIPVTLAPAPDGALAWSASIPIDDAASVRFALLTPDGADLSWDILDPAPSRADARVAPPAPLIDHALVEALADTPRAEFRAFTLREPGAWTVRVRTNAVDAAPPNAWLFVASDSPHRLRTSIHSLRHIPGESAVIVADMRADAARTAESSTITEALVHINDSELLPMHDDGAHGDGAAGDGVFGARIPLTEPGPLHLRVEARSVTESGASLLRSAEHRIEVVPGGMELLPNNATASIAPDPAPAAAPQLRIDIPIASAIPSRRILAAAELWGRDPETGHPAPAVWAALITEPRALADAGDAVSLFVDPRWLATSSIAAPFELRNIRLHDIDTLVPIALRDRAPLRIDGQLTLPASAPRAIDPAMRAGFPRADLALACTLSESDLALAATRALGAHNLMLSHGYCAGGSPWPTSDFSGFLEAFSDPDQNRTHDQFAQLLLAFGANSKSYGFVGHSQGGCAALHLWTFYFSGLDWAEGPRLIQSLGTPYQGTPLASLGGFSCGVNNNMTTDGAPVWLSTIPTASRASVWYWTTSYTSNWCDFFANLILAAPNDGTTEVVRGQLPGATNMGNKTGWCHTTGMSYPAQYTDSVRNAELNAQAAR